MSKRFIISIDKNGFVTAEVSGAKGKKCLDYIALLEDILEGKTISKEYTQEYYERQVVSNEEQYIKTEQQ
ncbi:MAG: DUF2997 domain-containing protein [Candidatus Azobacteroides sp.]|nr:DUF2997 domain-containing protein [Candidatus Azobacteroides sp.]